VPAIWKISSVEDHGGMLMAQSSHRSRLAQETVSYITVACEFASDDLDGNGSIQSEMCGEIDSAHATGPDLAFDPESTGNKLGDIHM
jgi:hypothetical protein